MPQWVNQQTKLIYFMNNHPKRNFCTQQLLISPSTIFSSLIADLQRARETIDMEYYIFANDRTGRLFANILGRKARQGLRVRLIVDGYGSRSLGDELRKSLEDSGVELHSHALMRQGRYHRKMAIIDDRIAHIGGINIADRYAVGNALGRWYDVQLRLTGDVVRSMSHLFDYDAYVSEGIDCEVPMFYSGAELEVVWSESRGGRAMAELLRDILDGVHDSLIVTTPYFMPPAWVMRMLSHAVERGVSVTLLVPERCDVWLLDHVMRRYVAEAMAQGIDVHICRGAFLHAKLAIVDRTKVVVGSANLDARSLYRNRELMAVTTNSGVVEGAERFIEEMLERSTAPTTRDTRSRIPAFLCRWFESLL